MGLSISYPPDDYLPAVDDNMGRLFIRSLSFDDAMMQADEAAAESPSPSALLPAIGSLSKLLIDGSLSFRIREPDNVETETTLSISSPRPDRKTEGNSNGSVVVDPGPSSGVPSSSATFRFGPAVGDCQPPPPDSPVLGMHSARHHVAALRLQKVYKSFRTRRQLADCAVLVEQRWWKLLDFAVLKQNSVSFFDIEKPETVVSKWSRARIKAAKVGKGLSKDEKAQKLALQHWLEAIDPRHRYGHNLHYYYHRWLHCQSKQPFFYWLDVGEGKDVNLDEHCPRSKLFKQCIKYLGPKEREAYEVVVEDARFMYKLSHQIVDTTGSDKGIKWIFVLSTSKNLYIGQKKKGVFQHSSFLAGGATSAAGRLVVEDGILKAVWPHSGHYRPTEQNFLEFMNFLKERNVDLTNVQLSSLEGEEDSDFSTKGGQSQLDLTELYEPAYEQEAKLAQDHNKGQIKTSNGTATVSSTERETSTLTTIGKVPSANRLHWKRPPRLEINSNNRIQIPASALSNTKASPGTKDTTPDSAMLGECLDFCKRNLFLEDGFEEEDLVDVPEELILSRINSKMSLMSYQLGKQLSFQWSTGAGPRIGCVRDYPSELQFMALEKVSLSPTRAMRFTSPRPSALTPNSIPTTQIDNMSIPLKPRKRSVTWDAF